MSLQAHQVNVIDEVFGAQDVMHKIMGHLDVLQLHVLGQTTKPLRKLCFNKIYFSKFSNENWARRGDTDESLDVRGIQRLCSVALRVDHLSFIRTLDLWLEELVVEHCTMLVGSLHHVTHLRLCCEQLCDQAVCCLASGFTLLHACHLITCPLLTPAVFSSFQSLPALTSLRLESCSGVANHPTSAPILQRTLPHMTSLRCLELNHSVSPSNAAVFAALSLTACNSAQPIRIHCHPKSCIEEPMFQTDFHCISSPLAAASFFCADCGSVQLCSERYITWFAEACCVTVRPSCEFLVFAFPQENNGRALPRGAVALRPCHHCAAGSVSHSPVQLDDGYFQLGSCAAVAIPIRAEPNHEREAESTGFSCMRRADGLRLPKAKSRQRQLWYACM